MQSQLWFHWCWLDCVSGMVCPGKAWHCFSSLGFLFCSLKSTLFLFTICDQISSCSGIVLWFSLVWIIWILCLDFKWLITCVVLEPLVFSIMEHKLHCGICWALLYKKWHQATYFLWILTPWKLNAWYVFND